MEQLELEKMAIVIGEQHRKSNQNKKFRNNSAYPPQSLLFFTYPQNPRDNFLICHISVI